VALGNVVLAAVAGLAADTLVVTLLAATVDAVAEAAEDLSPSYNRQHPTA